MNLRQYAGMLLGDSGYPLKKWLMTPYLNPSNRAEEKFNYALCSTRSAVERSGRVPLLLCTATSKPRYYHCT